MAVGRTSQVEPGYDCYTIERTFCALRGRIAFVHWFIGLAVRVEMMCTCARGCVQDRFIYVVEASYHVYPSL